MSEEDPLSSRPESGLASPLDLAALFAAGGAVVGLAIGGVEVVRQQHVQHAMLALAGWALVAPVFAAVVAGGFVGLGVWAAGRYRADGHLGMLALSTAALGIGLAPSAQTLGAWLQALTIREVDSVAVRFGSAVLEQPFTAAVLALFLVLVVRIVAPRPSPIGRLPALVNRVASPLVFVALAASATGWMSRGRSTGTPVVIIAIDTLRADHLGLYGYDRATDPALAALARDSVVYTRAIAPAPWTSPSMAASITGTHPKRLGFAHRPIVLPPDTVTMAEHFQNAGYRTRAVVSNLYCGSPVGYDQGYEVFDETEVSTGGHTHISSPAVTDLALDQIDRDAGLLLYAHYFDPHFGYAQHDDYVYDDDYSGPIQPLQDVVSMREAAESFTDRDLHYLRALYDSEVRFTDHHVGRLLDGLREKGLYDDALIVVYSDHGEELAERPERWIGHTRRVWQEQIHVPLLVKLPANRGAGTRIATPVGIVDVAPTVVELAGLEWKGGTDGVAHDPLSPTARPLYAETQRSALARTVVDGRFKLVTTPDQTVLIDLDADPGELRDVSAEHPTVRTRLEGLIEGFVVDLDPGTPVEDAVFTDEQTEALEALGYIDE